MNQTQSRIAIAASIILYGAAVTSVAMWLVSESPETAKRRLETTTSVTQFLPGKEPVVPSSWEEKAPPAEAMPEAAAPLPEVQQPEAETTPPINTETVVPEEVPQAAEPAPVSEPAVAPTPEPEQEAVVPLQKWQKFARAFDQKDTRPRIGLIVADLGLASAVTETAVKELPGEVSLSFSSVTPNLEEATTKARLAGHEIILSVPMEPEHYPQQDPGPNTLLLNLPNKDNVSRISWVMAQTDGYVAVMPSMGEKFVTSEQKLSPVLDVVKDQQVMILDSTLNKNSLIAPLSRLGKIPFTRSDALVDAASSTESLETQLSRLEVIAREQGQAIGIVVPYPAALGDVKTWIGTLAAKGIVLAPLTALASEEIPTNAAPATTQSLPADPKPE